MQSIFKFLFFVYFICRWRKIAFANEKHLNRRQQQQQQQKLFKVFTRWLCILWVYFHNTSDEHHTLYFVLHFRQMIFKGKKQKPMTTWKLQNLCASNTVESKRWKERPTNIDFVDFILNIEKERERESAIDIGNSKWIESTPCVGLQYSMSHHHNIPDSEMNFSKRDNLMKFGKWPTAKQETYI